MADCSVCGKSKNLMNEHKFKKNGEILYCDECFNKIKVIESDAENSIILTTTNTIDGFKVTQYIGIESVEIVIGIGAFTNFVSELNNVGGSNSSGFETKLQEAKKTAFSKLKRKALEQGASAVLAIDLDYAEFSQNRMGVIISGTLVKLQSL